MVTAKEIMTREVVTLTPDTEINDAARILLEKGFNGLPVVDEQGRVVGILCQSDLIAQQKRLPIPSVFTLLDSWIPLSPLKDLQKELKRITAITVKDAMTPGPTTIRPEATMEQMATLMVDRNFHTLPVVDGEGKLVGIVGKEDVLKTLIETPETA